MRLSCNGCRILRKGCGEDCVLKPCLRWIRNPESQGHATLFLAKFYGRAGLLNLISSGPPHLRPAICRSLLYESCGRIINPIFGSVGLLWSGRWHLCQAAVEAVLKGIPITQIPSDTCNTDSSVLSDHFKSSSGDIRHVNKEIMGAKLRNISRSTNRGRFKRSKGGRCKTKNIEYCFVVDENHEIDLDQRKGDYEFQEKVNVSSPEVIEIGSPEHEEMMDHNKHEWVDTAAALDLNSEQVSNRVCNTDLYKIDLNL